MTTIDPNRPVQTRDRTMTDFRVFIALLRDIALIAFAIVYIINTL